MRMNEGCSGQRSLARLVACTAFAALILHGVAAAAADVCESTQRACDAVEKGKLACRDAKGVVASGTPECVSDSSKVAACGTLYHDVADLRRAAAKLKEAGSKDANSARLTSQAEDLETKAGSAEKPADAAALRTKASDARTEAKKLSAEADTVRAGVAKIYPRIKDPDVNVVFSTAASALEKTNLDCAKVWARKPVCGATVSEAESVCAQDKTLLVACAAVDSDVCRAVEARLTTCGVVMAPFKGCDEFDVAEAACKTEGEACAQPPPDTDPKPDSWLIGFQPSVAAQLRIPQLSGLPPVFFANLVGIGVSFQTQHIEILPVAHFIGSVTDLQGPGAGQTPQASGVGVDGGLRVAVGWFDARTGGFYFSAYESASWLRLNATFSGNTPYSVSTTEISTDLGFGYKVPLSRKFRLDIFASAVHVGVRPGANNIVDLTSYPTLGLGLDLLPWVKSRN
jgi:hypothetical protein